MIKTKCFICKKELELKDDFMLFQNIRLACDDCEETAAEKNLGETQAQFQEQCILTSNRVRSDFPETYRKVEITDLTRTRNMQVKDFVLSQEWCFFIQGTVGAGKTHLSFVAIYEYAKKWNTERVQYYNAADLVSELQRDYSNDGGPSNYNRIKNAKILLIDDLGTEKDTDDSLHQIMRVVNHREQCNLKTIITTNLKMEEIKDKFHVRFISRIMAGKRIALKGEDKRNAQTGRNDV